MATEFLSAVVKASASRHVAAAVAVAFFRMVLGGDVAEEVEQRLAAIRPCISAQVRAAADGGTCHSARLLIDPSLHLRSNAAKHTFDLEGPFNSATDQVLRKHQRRRRKGQPSGGSSEHHDSADWVVPLSTAGTFSSNPNGTNAELFDISSVACASAQTDVSFPPCCFVAAGWQPLVGDPTDRPVVCTSDLAPFDCKSQAKELVDGPKAAEAPKAVQEMTVAETLGEDPN